MQRRFVKLTLINNAIAANGNLLHCTWDCIVFILLMSLFSVLINIYYTCVYIHSYKNVKTAAPLKSQICFLVSQKMRIIDFFFDNKYFFKYVNVSAGVKLFLVFLFYTSHVCNLKTEIKLQRKLFKRWERMYTPWEATCIIYDWRFLA